ncbi:MAG: NAD(P)H-binding protein [Phycisphaerales bacterium]|nr:NAD(P)H-binding protein [Phycisphaerales bacterium]
MDGTQTICITGGTGFVGRSVIRDLIMAGYRVRALCRDQGKGERIFPDGQFEEDALTWITGTLQDTDALNRLVKGCTGCVHLVGIIRETRHQTFDQAHHLGTRAMVDACSRENPGMRYIQMSALGVRNDPAVEYRCTKYLAEQYLKKSTLRWTIFRPGLIHGTDGEFTHMLVDWVRGKAPPFVFLPYFSRWKQQGFGMEAAMVAPIHVEELDQIFVQALSTDEAIGETFEITGPEQLRFDDMLRFVRETLPKGRFNRPAIGIPWRIAALQASVFGAVGLGGVLPFDKGMAVMGAQDSTTTSEERNRVQEAFGIAPTGFRDGFSSYAHLL